MSAGALGWVGAESHLALPEKEKEGSTDRREGAMGLESAKRRGWQVPRMLPVPAWDRISRHSGCLCQLSFY
jgi:hypothetical protein